MRRRLATARSKRWIFPVFLPNGGCPHRCAFCDQHAVTGQAAGLPEIKDLEDLFEKVRFSAKNGENPTLYRQIAFYGGNFTGLPRETQRRYLDWAAGKVRSGLVRSIRFSTRPDALGDDEIAFLRNYPVQTVEIGVQSLDDEVLQAVNRGHTADDCREAVARVVANGWEAGVQLMPGLPGETREGFLRGVEAVVGWGITMVRLYPAVVLRNTGLARVFEAGRLPPLTLDAAVEWCARACEIFEAAGVEVIRLGLPASDELRASVMAGPYHPAFGFLVQSFRFHERLRDEIDAIPGDLRRIQIRLPSSRLPLLMGHRRAAWEDLCARYAGREIGYRIDETIHAVRVDA